MITDYSAIPAPARRDSGFGPLGWVLLAFVALGLFAGGCGKPTETVRDNRRLLDAVLTAVTIRNLDELAKDKKLLDARKEAGHLSAESHSTIQRAIDLAQAKDWTTAERELYDFRGRVPFPK